MVATKTASKAQTTRTIKLTLTIEGIVYEVLPFEDEDDGLSVAEWKHTLIGAGRRRFHVYPQAVFYRKVDGSVGVINEIHRWHCTRCDRHDCQHIKAILKVGLS